MITQKLNKLFYTQPATLLAVSLLGKLICRNVCGDIKKYRITETECYYGFDDSACHAAKGKTERTKVMFEEGGILYIYLCYGMHNMLNIVTGSADHPEAVLIRGVDEIHGPGRVTKLLNIDKNLNAEDLGSSTQIWLEDDEFQCQYQSTKRIGIDYAAEKDRDKLWRYVVIS